MRLLIISGLLAATLITACDKKETTALSSASVGERKVEQSVTNPGITSVKAEVDQVVQPSSGKTEPTTIADSRQDYATLFNWNGVWKTTYGQMELTQFAQETVAEGEAPPAKVTGFYSTDGGQIEAQIYDGNLYGIWAENGSAQKCSTQKLGTYYWGGISFQKTDADNFEGIWSYCEELGPYPSQQSALKTSAWKGSRIRQTTNTPNDPSTNPSQTQTASSFGGTWDTSEGTMTLENLDQLAVEGTYSQDNGRIQGSMKGNQLVGYWIENGSAQRCSQPKDGSYHWGRIVFTLNADKTAFDGRWSYCDKEPSSSWTGTKR